MSDVVYNNGTTASGTVSEIKGTVQKLAGTAFEEALNDSSIDQCRAAAHIDQDDQGNDIVRLSVTFEVQDADGPDLSSQFDSLETAAVNAGFDDTKSDAQTNITIE